MESLMIDFWFPLEEAVSKLPSKTADHLDANITCGSLCDALRSHNTKVAASYMMSGLLLLMALHATRMIDLRKLAEGPSSFFGDIGQRLKLSLSKVLQGLGLCPERRVKFGDEYGKKEFTSMEPYDGNISANSNSSRLGSDEGYGRNYKYTRRRLRRRRR
nr:unnamed protein product [Callosobruchus chinensis]